MKDLLERLRRALATGRVSEGCCGEHDLALFPERNASPVLLVSRDGRVLYANPAAGALLDGLGLGPEPRRLLPAGFVDDLRAAWAGHGQELTFQHLVGDRVLEGRVHLLRDEGRGHVYLTDATRAQRAEERLVYEGRHDGLTGLGNRASFEDRLEQALGDRRGAMVAAFLVDVDRLSLVNDSLGHPAGDELLRAAGKRLVGALRRAGRGPAELFRFQGDAFAALLTAVESEAAPARVAREMVECFQQPFRVAGQDLFATASVGIAVAPADGTDVSSLVRGADVALSSVKRGGGNGFRCHAAGLDAMAREWLALESGLRTAVRLGELSLAFQPQVELGSLKETGREALLRWHDPARGVVPPSRFIPVAEGSALISTLGAWALRAACEEASLWTNAEGVPRTVAVNVSARQFHEPRFPQLVRDVLDDTGLEPHRLELEVTETVAMGDTDDVVHTLKDLKDVGVSLAIDDFGTGYSSLSSLKRFPIDRLKLDQSFVRNLGEGARDDAVARAVIDIGHRLGLRVLAEGVETEEQLAALRAWGCDDGQGFLLGRPAETASPR